MKPAFTQELIPDTLGLRMNATLPDSCGCESSEPGFRAHATAAISVAFSIGVTGTLISSAHAVEPVTMATLPSVMEMPSVLPSYGADRPVGTAAKYHTVSDGETIWEIAQAYGVTVESIRQVNALVGDQVIQAGQVLRVPSLEPQRSSAVSSMPVEPEATLAVEPAAPASVAKVLERSSPALSLNDADALRAVEQLQASAEDVLNSVPESVGTEVVVPLAIATSDITDRPSERHPFGSVEDDAEVKITEVAPQEESLSFVDGANSSHRVQPGETLWSIAHSHGIDLGRLRAANDITDSALIYPGETLALPLGNIPAGRASLTAAEERADAEGRADVEETSSVASAGSDKVLGPLTLESSLAATAADEEGFEPQQSLSEVPAIAAAVGASAPILADEVSPDLEPEAGEPVDPYVAALLSDVAASTEAEAISEEVVSAPTPAASLPTEEINPDDALVEADAPAEAAVVSRIAPESVVNPEFTDISGDDPEELPETGALSSEELLAAAPLGSEVYAPIVEHPEGKLVSPEMPIMPAQEEFLPEAPSRFNGYMWPARGVLTSGYGWRWGRMHQGIDVAGPVGTPIFAAAPGVVVRAGWNSGGYGNLVDVRHPDGSLTRYAHNSRILVRSGQQVRQGQQIAEMGSTGYSTGPHLHFELHVPERGAVNPMAHLPSQ